MKERIFKAWGLSVVGLIIILVATYLLVTKVIVVQEFVIVSAVGSSLIFAKKSDFIPKKDE